MSVASIPGQLKVDDQPSRTRERDQRSVWSRVYQRERDDVTQAPLWRAALAEFVGGFLLVVFTVGVGLSEEGTEGVSLLQVALGCGFFLSVIVSALGGVSGGHVNPAVSLGFLLTGQISCSRFLIYTIFQTAGGIAGAAFLKQAVPSSYVGSLGLLSPAPGVTVAEAFLSELVITCLLLFVIIALVDRGRSDVQGSIPFMVGCTVTVNILFGAKISGGCMNPIRNFGPAVLTGNLQNIWIYWAGPLCGAAVGSLLYQLALSTQPLTHRSWRCGVTTGPRSYRGVRGQDGHEEKENLSSRSSTHGGEEESRII